MVPMVQLKLVATATVIAACCSTVAYRAKVLSFQTPITYPLLKMGKRLAQRHRIGGQFPLMPSFVAIGDGQMKNDGADKLVEWLEGRSGFSPSVAVGADSQGLRGLYAKNDIKSGQIIVEVPYDSALLVGDSIWARKVDDFDVPGSDEWSTDDLDDVYQGLNFLRHFVGNREYSPYVDNLPQTPSSGDDAGLTPDFWSSEFISGLEVPALVKQIQSRKQIVEEVAKKRGVNENELRWATFMVRSRRFTTWNMIDDPKSKQDRRLFGVFPLRRNKIEQTQGFLLPLIDMANHEHNPNAGLRISVNRVTRGFDDTSKFALKALRPIKKGEEVTISYGEGDRTSLDLLDKYGFFAVGNEADKKIDWEELSPKFTTTLEEDEAELAMTANMNPQSKRTMLSLRILMKRLSNFQMKTSDNDGWHQTPV